MNLPKTLKKGNQIYCHADCEFRIGGGKKLTFLKGKFYSIEEVVPYGDEYIVIRFNDKFTEMFSLRKKTVYLMPMNYYENFFYDLEKSRKLKLKKIKI